MPTDDYNELEKQALELVREATVIDAKLREKHQVGTKFRFVRDRLHALLEQLESNQKKQDVIKQETKRVVAEDEMIVFVHLFNANGVNLRSWQNMVTPAVLYEYSVNRPIYTDKAHIELLIKSKSNKLQHGYLSIAVKRVDVVESATGAPLKDAVGNPIIKVREGSLHFDKIVHFTHNGIDYRVNEEGEMIKK